MNKNLAHNGNLLFRPNNYILYRVYTPIYTGYKYFLWYVEYTNYSEFQQQDFALSTDGFNKITGFTCIAGKQSSNPETENYPNGFDGNSDTKWYSGDTYPNWAIFTYNEIPIRPYGFWFMTGNDHAYVPSRAPQRFKLCGSNTLTTDPNDPSWVTLIDTTNNPDTTFVDVNDNQKWIYESFNTEFNTISINGIEWTTNPISINDGNGGIYTYTVNLNNDYFKISYYNGYAAMRIANSINGYHLPTTDEVEQLITYMGGYNSTTVYHLKYNYYWNNNGDNLEGFCAVPFGMIDNGSLSTGNESTFWNYDTVNNSYNRLYILDNGGIANGYENPNNYCYPLRLVKD